MNPYVPLAVLMACIGGLAATDILTAGALSGSTTTVINGVAGAALGALGWRAASTKEKS